jgi:hypothetical protein
MTYNFSADKFSNPENYTSTNTKRLNINHKLKWYVAHIEDDATALRVARALADCTPAHALMELVRNDGFSLEDCSQAYKNQYSNRKSWAGWSLAGDEIAEFEYEKAHDI